MFKFTILILIFILFSGCSYKNNSLVEVDEVGLINPNYIETTFSNCSVDTYIAKINHEKYGKLFVENIDLSFECRWNGLARSYFEGLFEQSLKVKMKVVQRVDYANYELTTYLINDQYYLNLIYKYYSLKDLFILDYDGKFTASLVKKYGIKFDLTHLNEKRFFQTYNDSLVNKNIINIYFQKDRGFFPKY